METMEQIGTVLLRIIEALAGAPTNEGDVMFSKLDIKNGFWQMVCKLGGSGTLPTPSPAIQTNQWRS